MSRPYSSLEEFGPWPRIQDPQGHHGHTHAQDAGAKVLLSPCAKNLDVPAHTPDDLAATIDHARRSGEADERLNLSDFLMKVPDWRLNADRARLQLVLDADEIKLAEWFKGLGTTTDWEAYDHEDRMTSSFQSAEPAAEQRSLAINVDEVRAFDLFALRPEGDLFERLRGTAPVSDARVTRSFDLNEVSVAEILAL